MRRCLLLYLALLPASALTTLNVSEDLVHLGISTQNMVPNQPTLDSAGLFNQAVLFAVQHSIGRIIADPGAYYFLSQPFAGYYIPIPQPNNLTIDFQGSMVRPTVGGPGPSEATMLWRISMPVMAGR